MIPQFFLFTSEIDDPFAEQAPLKALLETGVFSVVMLKIAAESDASFRRKAELLRSTVQDAGAACLIAPPEDARLVARLGMDGVHLATPSRLNDAIEALKPDRIVGVGGLRSRHDAMEAGERDIDYVMFGEPRADGSLPAFEQTMERAAWWSEIFTLPCIAYAPDLASVAPLVATGAEFIALGSWIFAESDPSETAAQARRIAKEEHLRLEAAVR